MFARAGHVSISGIPASAAALCTSQVPKDDRTIPHHGHAAKLRRCGPKDPLSTLSDLLQLLLRMHQGAGESGTGNLITIICSLFLPSTLDVPNNHTYQHSLSSQQPSTRAIQTSIRYIFINHRQCCLRRLICLLMSGRFFILLRNPTSTALTPRFITCPGPRLLFFLS